jgi:2-methylcitrate dehydratase
MRKKIADLSQIERIVIHTSAHTHHVIGTGACDPQKFAPQASRETLDHSIMYIFAVALEDGTWHHVDSYLPERRKRDSTLQLWRSVTTREDDKWTARYHAKDPSQKAFGGRVEIFFRDGSRIEDELAVANAHPLGAAPFGRDDYLHKFKVLTDQVLSEQERDRFVQSAVKTDNLLPSELHQLNVALPTGGLHKGSAGIF